ncbi:PA2169 family four-helix-bundle protein [uncultured Paraglaciecola sp.]|uniref:PA2169 family four-helix-bundle protein n=1 Tax=uncultured Paraglaciecola sp. TaxID=1765024 RepID=UPI0030D94DE0
MLNQTTSVEKVTDVIQVMSAGVEFYHDAVEQVNDSFVKNTFIKMASKKEAAIQALQPLAVQQQGEVEDGTSIVVDSRKLYTKFAAMFSDNEDYTYVKQLEEVEDKVLEVLDEALNAKQPLQAMSVLTHVRADAQLMHDEMKSLQEQSKH